MLCLKREYFRSTSGHDEAAAIDQAEGEAEHVESGVEDEARRRRQLAALDLDNSGPGGRSEPAGADGTAAACCRQVFPAGGDRVSEAQEACSRAAHA
ncbi:hypothetical protein PMKS-001540 [Pichia membranifaciens]|uniref:Uncharacterized protein n=1 Tax=Pichia membranifaciens TaxID=4926 RepID=A0A1Q2YEU3_9ASCO|nr:hypothetical protein PMKS-001540 [Pichia membranifaciens]